MDWRTLSPYQVFLERESLELSVCCNWIFTLPDIIIYFNTIQDPAYRIQGFAAIISVVIFLLYFAREAFSPQTDTSE